jgi:lipoprotein-releasing system permease protein
MNVEYFIAKKLFSSKKKNNSFTKPIINIAIIAVAISVSVMLISLIVMKGFKKDISSKVIGFGSHILVTNFSNNNSYESEALNTSLDLKSSLKKIKGIKSVNAFATKAAIIKTKQEIHGVVLKGVSHNYDWSFFNDNLIDGEPIRLDLNSKSSDVLISEEISNLLKLNVSDKLIMYFMQEPTRVRKFNVKGIYSTAMVDFDKLYVLGDIKHIQSLNSWTENQVGGFELSINDFSQLDQMTNAVYEAIPYDLNAQSIKEKVPQIFDWLDLQDMNVMVILILMLLVAGINMITALLILILERTKLIGILKAIGATNWSIRKIFVYLAVYLSVRGLIIGNSIALLLTFLQFKFSIISLDPQTYYMSTVPIYFDFQQILLLNLFAILICYLILIIPSMIISRISPIKAIRFQ